MHFLTRTSFDGWSKGQQLGSTYRLPEPSVIRVSADDLQKEYSANEVRADLKYRDKEVLVTGVVASIDRSVGSNYHLVLHGGQNRFMSPHAKMSDGFVEYLAGLKKGQTVSLVGKCEGMLLGSASLSGCVPSETWVESCTKRYVEKYVHDLPGLIREGNRQAMDLAIWSTVLDSVLATPIVVDANLSDPKKEEKRVYAAAGVCGSLAGVYDAPTENEKSFKRHKVNNNKDLVEALVVEELKKEGMERKDLVPDLVVKGADGKEMPVFQMKLQKYGKNTSLIIRKAP